MSIEPSRPRVSRFIVAALLILGLSVPVSELVAQDEEAPSAIDELKDERERLAREAAISAQGIDVRTATVEEVTAALEEIAEFVEIQRIRLSQAEASYEASIGAVEQAEIERVEVMATADALRRHLSDLAVASFTGESGTNNDEVTELVLSDDPGESARFIHLLELQTGSLGDGLDRLRALEIQAEELILEQVAASARAAENLAEVELRSAELDTALEQQALIVSSAELRLEAQLAETAFLEEQQLQLAALVAGEQDEINALSLIHI